MHHTEGAGNVLVFSKQREQQLTSPTYNIDNTHMYIQLLTTVTPTNIYRYIHQFLHVIRDLVCYVLQLYLQHLLV
jgi:hypothetical protein